MSSFCWQCVQVGHSCCEGRQILLTMGDVQRIESFLKENNFCAIEPLEAAYLDPGDDPLWLALTVLPDGRRRVLKRTPANQCPLLGETGCRLSMEVRPLVCRLYPYLYTEAGLCGLDPECAASHCEDWPLLLEQMGMTPQDAQRWHEMLYKELWAEKLSNGVGVIHSAQTPVLAVPASPPGG